MVADRLRTSPWVCASGAEPLSSSADMATTSGGRLSLRRNIRRNPRRGWKRRFLGSKHNENIIIISRQIKGNCNTTCEHYYSTITLSKVSCTQLILYIGINLSTKLIVHWAELHITGCLKRTFLEFRSLFTTSKEWKSLHTHTRVCKLSSETGNVAFDMETLGTRVEGAGGEHVTRVWTC